MESLEKIYQCKNKELGPLIIQLLKFVLNARLEYRVTILGHKHIIKG